MEVVRITLKEDVVITDHAYCVTITLACLLKISHVPINKL